jgi:hypothetical protein
MERELLEFQLREIGMKYSTSNRGGKLFFEIPLEPNHIMFISPSDDSGFVGHQYMKFKTEKPIHVTNEEVLTVTREIVCANIEIVNLSADPFADNFTIQLRKRNMKVTFTAAMLSYFKETGIRLVPVRKAKRSA